MDKFAIGSKVRVTSYPAVTKMIGQVGTIKERLNISGSGNLQNMYCVLLELGVSFWFSDGQLELIVPEK